MTQLSLMPEPKPWRLTAAQQAVGRAGIANARAALAATRTPTTEGRRTA